MEKISLQQAAVELEKLCDELDELEQIGPLVTKLFAERKETFEEALNRRIRYILYLNSQIDHAKKMRDLWVKRLAVIETTHARVSDNTKQIVSTCEGLKFKSELGELRVQRNSIPSVVLRGKLAEYDTKFIPLADSDKLKAHAAYLSPGFKLDRDLLRQDLLDGKAVPEAELVSGTHLRVRI